MSTSTQQSPGPAMVLGRDPLLLLLALPPAMLTLGAWLAEMYDAESMAVLAVVSAAACMFSIVRCYRGIGSRNELPLLVLYGALAFWYYYPCVVVAFSDRQWDRAAALIRIDNRHALSALLGVNLLTLVIAGCCQIPIRADLAQRVRRWLGPQPAPASGRMVALVLVGLLAGIAFYVIIAGGPLRWIELALQSRVGDKPWSREGYQGSSVSVLDLTSSAIIVAMAAFALHLALDSDLTRRQRLFVAAAGIVGLTMIAVDKGARSILIQAVMPAFGVYYRRVSTWLSAERLRRSIVLVLATLVVVAAADAQRRYRTTTEIEGVTLSIEDNDFFTQTAYAYAIQERERRFFHDSALLHILAGPVPRVVWPNKPVMESMFVFTEYQWGVDIAHQQSNALPGIVGQYYLNGGWLSVAQIGLFLGLLVRLLDSVFLASRSRDLARFGALAVMAFVFVKFRQMSAAFVPSLYACLLITLIAGRWSALRPRGLRAGPGAAEPPP